MTEAEELEQLVKRIINEQTSLDQADDFYNKMGLIKHYADKQVKKALENQSNVWKESNKQIAIDTEKYVIAIIEKSLMSDESLHKTLLNTYIEKGIRFQRDKIQEAINKLKKG